MYIYIYIYIHLSKFYRFGYYQLNNLIAFSFFLDEVNEFGFETKLLLLSIYLVTSDPRASSLLEDLKCADCQQHYIFIFIYIFSFNTSKTTQKLHFNNYIPNNLQYPKNSSYGHHIN